MPFDERKFARRAASATEALADTDLGPVQWVPETGSTNADLLAAGAAGAPHGLIRVADHQTAGRGRRDRVWTASPGSALLMSVLLRPSMGADALGSVTAAVGVAAAEQCRAMGYEGIKIKWPNDLVVGAPGAHRKLGGILAQSHLATDSTFVVVGLGLNLGGEGLLDLGTPAVALDELGHSPDPVEVLAGLAQRLSGRLLQLGDGLSEPLWERYRELSATLGTRVVVTQDRGSLEGDALDVNPAGALIIATETGRQEVVVGDVVSLRALHGRKPQ